MGLSLSLRGVFALALSRPRVGALFFLMMTGSQTSGCQRAARAARKQTKQMRRVPESTKQCVCVRVCVYVRALATKSKNRKKKPLTDLPRQKHAAAARAQTPPCAHTFSAHAAAWRRRPTHPFYQNPSCKTQVKRNARARRACTKPTHKGGREREKKKTLPRQRGARGGVLGRVRAAGAERALCSRASAQRRQR